jgi:hypothetical protein
MQGATPYVRIGNAAVVALLAGLLALGWRVSRQRAPG